MAKGSGEGEGGDEAYCNTSGHCARRYDVAASVAPAVSARATAAATFALRILWALRWQAEIPLFVIGLSNERLHGAHAGTLLSIPVWSKTAGTKLPSRRVRSGFDLHISISPILTFV